MTLLEAAMRRALETAAETPTKAFWLQQSQFLPLVLDGCNKYLSIIRRCDILIMLFSEEAFHSFY